MGKQVQFHMLPEDMQMFLDFIQKQGDVVIAYKSLDSPEVLPIPNPVKEVETMVIWNRELLRSLERKLIQRPGGSDYYRVDDSLPTIDITPSRITKWKDTPALLQGRIYVFFDKPVPGYDEWYKTAAHWLKSNFIKSPLKLLKGYVGPKAFDWYSDGGILLPMFEPPLTPEWLSFVANQHASDSSKLE
jgi:hypothetical protein